MLERPSLKVLDEAWAVLEQGFSAMPEFKAALALAAHSSGFGARVEV